MQCLSKNSYPCLYGLVSISLITFSCCISCLQTTLLKVITPYLVMQDLAFFFNFSPLCVLYPCWSSDFSVMVVLGHNFTLTHIGYSHITPPTTTRSQTMSLSFKFPHLLRHLMGFPCLVFLMSIAFLFAVQTHRQAGTVDTTHR